MKASSKGFMFLAVIIVLAVTAVCVKAADPVRSQPMPPTRAEFDNLEKRVAVLEKRSQPMPAVREFAAKDNCGEPGCPANGGAGCTCVNCPCRPAGMKGAVPLVKGYHQGQVTWIPEGYEDTLPGWVRAAPTPTPTVQYTCSNGVCTPATTAGYQQYGGLTAFYSPQSYGGEVQYGGGGSCAGGSCGSSGGQASYTRGGGLFGRRR